MLLCIFQPGGLQLPVFHSTIPFTVPFTAPSSVHKWSHAPWRLQPAPKKGQQGAGALPVLTPKAPLHGMAVELTPRATLYTPQAPSQIMQSIREGLPVYVLTVLLGLLGVHRSRTSNGCQQPPPDLHPCSLACDAMTSTENAVLRPLATWTMASASGKPSAPGDSPDSMEASPAPGTSPHDADAVHHTFFHRLATLFPKRSRSLMFILLGQVCLWMGSYIWFFETLELVNIVLRHFPALEIPVYITLSLLPAFCLKQRIFEPSLSVALRGLGMLSGSVFIRHCLISAIRPLDRAIKVVLIFFSSNLFVSAIPKRFYFALPTFWHFLDRGGYTTLSALQIQEGWKDLSTHALNVAFITLFAQWLMKIKSVPKDFVHDARENGLLEQYWTALANGNGPAIVLNIVINAVIVIAVVPEWLQLLGISPQTILTFGGVGGLALGLASQDVVGNLVSGLLLLLRQPFVAGEEIRSGTRRGTVKEVGWFSTLIEASDGSMVYIPNRTVMQREAVNLTAARTRLMTLDLPLKLPRSGSKSCQVLLTSVTAAIKANPTLKEVLMGAPVAYLDFTMQPEPMALLKLEVLVDGAKVSFGDLDVYRSRLLITVIDSIRAATDGAWV